MDAAISRAKFQEADQLFRAARYQEALTLLEELNQHHPNAKNVMYPAALCLDKLGRSQEALPLCNHLIQAFQDPRAQALKAEIEGRALSGSLDGMYDMSSLDLDGLGGTNDILDIPTTTVPHKPVEPEGIPWLKYGLIGLAAVVVLLIVVVPLVTYEPPPPGAEPAVSGSDGGTGTTPGAIWFSFAGFILTYVAFQVAAVYLALMITRSLPFEDFASNAFNLTITLFFISLIEMSRWAIILVPFYFSRVYDLGIGGVIFVYVLRFVFGVVGFFVGLFVFFGSITALQESLPF